MKAIVNFYVEHTPEGNQLRWVGNVKNRSSFVVKRSTNELDFGEIHEIDLQKSDGLPYSYLDEEANPNVTTYYQVDYKEGEEIIEASPVVNIGEPQQTNWMGILGRVGAVVAVLVLGGLLARNLSQAPPPVIRSEAAKQARFVDVQPVQYQSFNTTVEALGQVITTQPIDIVSEVGGKILKGDVVLKKANRFNQGATLFSIDQQEALLNLKAQRSNFQNAIALILADLKLDFPNSYDKWNNYFNSIQIDRTLPEMPSVTEQREKVFLASKNISGQFYTIRSQEERLRKYLVTAPYAGIILDVYTTAGSVANPGTRVVKIRKTSGLELELPVRKEDMKWVRAGKRVKLYSEDKKTTTSGVINRIGSQIDPNTQSINVYVSVGGGKMKLYEGQYLYAEIAGSSVTSAMEIPRKAIVNDREVFVVQDSILARKSINILKVNEETLLFSGLDKGELVVQNPFLGAENGVKVVPENSQQ